MAQYTFDFHPNASTDIVRSKTIMAWDYEDAERELLRAFPGAIIVDVFI